VILMRSMLPLLLAGALAPGAFAQLVSAPPADHCEEGTCGKAEMLRRRAAAGLPVSDFAGGAGGYTAREAMTDTDVLHYVLDIEVFPDTEVITGSNTITVRSLVNNLTQFTFMLRSQYTVTEVLLNGTTPASATTPGANSYARRVTLDRPYNAGEEFTVKISYTGVAVARGFGSIVFGHQNNNTANPRTVETLSEAYFAATWWPCKDGDVFLPGDNSDKATMDFSVTAPSIYKTTANGLLHSVTPVSGGKSKYRYITNYPTATYLIAFATTVYNSWTLDYVYPLPGGGTGTMPVEFNIWPVLDTPSNRNAWGQAVPMLHAFRPFFGEYPFINEKYGIYHFGFGGGMEHQTNSGQGTFGLSVTAHELAHQWWGDAVTCKTWNDIWLNEGFATYGEALWEEQRPGSQGLASYLAAIQARKPSQVSSSVYVYDASDMNRIFSSTYSYRKGAWVLHMLRKVVGDQTFYDILAAYRAQYEDSAATTDDFAAIASAVAGRDLTWFFTQWVYGSGAPAYAIGTQAVTIGGEPYLRVRLRQTQNSAWPGAGAPAGYFAMPIDLRVDTGAGSQTVTLNNDARTQHFLVPAAAAVTGSELDQFGWVLSTDIVSEPFVAGPPVIVSAAPAPNAGFEQGDPPAQVVVQFSEAITGSAASVTLSDSVGPVAGSTVISGSTATFTPAAALQPGPYTVSVSSINALSGGLALDGETPGTTIVGGGPFPSGNGVAGGAATWTFFVIASDCGTADFDGDGDTGTDADIEAFFACLAGSCCAMCYSGGADFDGDGDTGTDADIESFFRVLAGGNC
jgi:aminopeptidase N